MFSKDRWNEILEALNANRFRTLMTAFGVFWGIMILVLLLALTNGLKNGVTSDFGSFATNSIFMWAQGTSMSYKGMPKGRRFNFKLKDVDMLKENIPELKLVPINGNEIPKVFMEEKNVVVEDAVLDSDSSLVIEQANNRTYAAQLVLKKILENA